MSDRKIIDENIMKYRLLSLFRGRRGEVDLEVVSAKTGVPVKTLAPFVQKEKDNPLYDKRTGRSNLEDNSKIPSLDTLFSIATGYGVSMDWLCGLSDVKTPNATLKTVHKRTGLSEEAIERISHIEKPFIATAENPNAGTLDKNSSRGVESFLRKDTHFATVNFGLVHALDDFLSSAFLVDLLAHFVEYFYSYENDVALIHSMEVIAQMKTEIADKYGINEFIHIYRGEPTLNLEKPFKKLREALKKTSVTVEEEASVRLMLANTQVALETLFTKEGFEALLAKTDLTEYMGFPDVSIEEHNDGPKPKYIGKKKKAVAAGGDG